MLSCVKIKTLVGEGTTETVFMSGNVRLTVTVVGEVGDSLCLSFLALIFMSPSFGVETVND